jgi:NAD(P)-dependent dehydrogenase (short-subunit alcohol dehydrogenase family)
MERAPEADGIPVNTVHPGVIDTPIWTKLPVSAGSNAPIDPNEVAKAGVPLGRAGQAQDIANGVPFLASDASSYRRVRNWWSTAAWRAARDLAGAEWQLGARLQQHRKLRV